MNGETNAHSELDETGRKVLTVVIALTQPKVSEAWMARMTGYLAPSVVFVSVVASSSSYKMPDHCVELADEIKGVPQRVMLFLQRRKIQKRLKEILREWSMRYEIKILCHYMTTATYLWPVLKGYQEQLFIHVHGHDVTWDRKWERYPIIPAHGPRYRQRARECGRNAIVVANSRATICKLVENGIPESSIRLKYLGVPYNTEEDDNGANKGRSGTKKIVYLGRLVDFKGPLETLRAFEQVVERGCLAELHFIGDGRLRKRLKKQVQRNRLMDKVWVHGALPYFEAMKLLHNAYVLTAHNKVSVLTGQEEAFGVAIVEAMMLGVPVVTGRSGGVIETVEHERTGLLFEPGDINAHASALCRLINEPEFRDILANNAKIVARRRFSVDTEAEKLRGIMNLHPAQKGKGEINGRSGC